MADMDRDSDTEDDYEDDDDVGDSCDDSDYDYTGEESNLEEAERCGFDWQDEEVETFSNGEDSARRVDWEYCERDQPGQQVLLSRRLAGAAQVYAPERGPPLLDFLFVLTAFFAATFAAFYTILSETGVNKK